MESFAVLAAVTVQLFLLFLDTASCNTNNICPTLTYVSLRNGNITSAGKGMLRFQCNKEYYLGGPSLVRCWKGKWTSTAPPVCHEAEGLCDYPAKIENGDVHGDDRKEGSVIRYLCHPGYVLFGEKQRICSRNGAWSGRSPSCLDESEPLSNVAKRLEKQFVTKMVSYSSRNIVKGRLLDDILKGLELVILLDRSSSIDPKDFQSSKDFVKFLFNQFGVKNGNTETNGTRVAVLAFGTEVNVVFNVDNETITSSEAAGKALDKVKPGGGGTALEPALTTVFVEVTNRLRNDAKKALFLITDGEPNVGSEQITPEDMANMLKETEDFEIFAIGIGRDWNRKLLARIASEPTLNHVFFLDGYSDLNDMISIIRNSPTEVPPPSPERCGYIDQNKKAPEVLPWMAAVYVSLPINIRDDLKKNDTVEVRSNVIPEEHSKKHPKEDTEPDLKSDDLKVASASKELPEEEDEYDYDYNDEVPRRKRSIANKNTDDSKARLLSKSIKDESRRLGLCGGVLICSQWLLTAASCFFNVHERNSHRSTEEVFVVLQENYLTEADRTKKNFYAVDVIIHPDFDSRNDLLHNLALIKLNEQAPIEKYRPVCLPPTDKTVPLHMDFNINTTVAGWGLPPIKNGREVFTAANTRLEMVTKTQSLADERECRQSIRRVAIDKSIFCAGLGSMSNNNCVGNVGSPIIAKDPLSDIHHVLGIVSQRSECKQGYSQYTELGQYIPWIGQVTNDCYLQHWN